MTTNAYTQDGVNVAEGDSFSEYAGEICRSTFDNCRFVGVRSFSGHFRGPRGLTLKGLPDGCYLDALPDGIGTKVVLIDAARSYEDAARDLVAMPLGDVTRWGGMGVSYVNILDAGSIGENGDEVNVAFRAMMRGLKIVCDEMRLVLLRGETAELSTCIGSENPDAVARFLWSGVVMGVYDPKRIITGDTLAPGMAVIALRERGFRSNGISSVRKALAMHFGADYFTNPDALEAIRLAATPSTLYDRLLEAANGWDDPSFKPLAQMHLIAHITGGGIVTKFFKDILEPRGLSAVLDGLYEPPEIMRQCAEWRRMDDREFYSVWNGGQGALVVVEQSDVDSFVTLAERYSIEAKQVGVISREPTPTLTIGSYTGRTLQYI